MQIITVSLIEEIVLFLNNVDLWLPTLKQHSIVPCLLDSVKLWIEVSLRLSRLSRLPRLPRLPRLLTWTWQSFSLECSSANQESLKVFRFTIWSFQARQGIQYVEAVLLFFLTLSKIPLAAETLAVNGINPQLCLAMGALYSSEIAAPVQRQQPATPQVPIIPQSNPWSS